MQNNMKKAVSNNLLSRTLALSSSKLTSRPGNARGAEDVVWRAVLHPFHMGCVIGKTRVTSIVHSL